MLSELELIHILSLDEPPSINSLMGRTGHQRSASQHRRSEVRKSSNKPVGQGDASHNDYEARIADLEERNSELECEVDIWKDRVAKLERQIANMDDNSRYYVTYKTQPKHLAEDIVSEDRDWSIRLAVAICEKTKHVIGPERYETDPKTLAEGIVSEDRDWAIRLAVAICEKTNYEPKSASVEPASQRYAKSRVHE
jgi:hypothetical protein